MEKIVFKSHEGPGMRSADLDDVDFQCFQHSYETWAEGRLWKNQCIINDNDDDSISIILQILILKKNESSMTA